MSQDIFNQRIARIKNRSGSARSMMTTAEGGTVTSKFSSPVMGTNASTARRGIKPMLLGAVIGMIIGALAAGLENPAMPWGPGFEYNQMLVLPVLLALCAAPVMAIATATMRARFPTLFFFSAAYFPFAIGAAMLDLPLF
ncbi:hypothetical protein ABMC88_12175 [Sulfitobacter sp. HNIBRBA2951]|uniref:hypothetical protein n=1 Tax=Sulfitobacter aquimarinus TaxID=3158557 RepID=UPI0032DFACD6